jgi:hypothetical protein
MKMTILEEVREKTEVGYPLASINGDFRGF